MSYRPITDTWILTRAALKQGVKYYGAYPGGFPERARVLVGCPLDQPMLHVCGGMARSYKYSRGFGPYDKTMDLNPACKPDFLQDARDKKWPTHIIDGDGLCAVEVYWGGILIDRPYTELDADQYPPGRDKLPNPHELMTTAINHVALYRKVGMIDYIIPRLPKNAKYIASVKVEVGFGNRPRQFTVFERIS
jgi:hypothetical protein